MNESATATLSSQASEATKTAAPAAAQNAEPVKAAAPAAPAQAEPAKSEPSKAEPKKESFADKLEAARKSEPEAEAAPAADVELDIPEGADPHVVELTRDAARIAGIPKEKAQAVFDHLKKTLPEKHAAISAKMREDFARQLYEDKDFGGDKFNATVRDSEAFIRRFVPASAQKEMEGKAIPPFLRIAFARAQQAISPDKLFVAKSGPAKADSESALAKQLFPRSLAGRNEG